MISSASCSTSSRVMVLSANEKDKLPGRLQEDFHTAGNQDGGPVSFIRWILIIASPGMARACPSGYTAQGPKALAWSWDFQKRVYASTTVRDQARRHPSGGSSNGGNDYEILQPTASILLRR